MSSRLVNYLLACIALVFVLIYLKPILVPFIFALITWFLINEVRHNLDRIGFIKKYAPGWIKNLFSFVVIYGVISACVTFISGDLSGISDKMPGYEKNLEAVVNQLDTWMQGKDWIDGTLAEKSLEFIDKIEVSTVVSSTISTTSSLLGNVFLVILYVIFLMAERGKLTRKIKNMFTKKHTQENVNEVLEKINRSISRYLTLKTIVSIITGGLSYIVLLILKVDFAGFWAFLIFTLNYIPTVGSLIATLFPTLMAMLQYGDVGTALWVLGLIGSIQVLVGNFIEPKIMGDSLNISSLVVLLTLAFWGLIWGVEGMMLCVPITVIIIIVLARFPSTRPVAILLSENGNV